jgi:biopolymer transport protein ExbB
MRRYASSKFRILLFVALIGAALFAMAAPGFAQDAAAAAGGETTTVKKENLFSLILHNIDFVFITIALLSIVGITLIIQGFIKNRASVMIPETSTNAIREMIAQKKFKELIEFTETDPSFVSRALNPALKRAPSFSSMKEAMETAIGEQTAEQFRKIEYLNIIGNLGPLLGLLGTVLGMIVAFNEMNAAGAQGANPAQLAGGISKALAHTFLGLILAVPCLAAFGVLRTIVDRLTVRGALISEELLLMVKPADAKMPQPGAPAAAPAVIPGRPPVGPAPLPAAQPQPIPGLPRKPATPSPVGPS